MASYKATTTIRHGGKDGVKVFEPGDQVTGLTKVEMASLWESGAIEAVETPAAAEPVKVTAESDSGSTGDQASGEKSGGDN